MILAALIAAAGVGFLFLLALGKAMATGDDLMDAWLDCPDFVEDEQ